MTAQQQYHRVRITNRQMEDYQRNILMYLDKVGPCSITELTFHLETTSHALVRCALAPLIANEFIIKQVGHRQMTRRLKNQRSNRIQILLAITQRGKELLKKQKKLASFIRWKDG